MTEDLHMIDADPSVVTFKGNPVQVKPLTIGQIPAFARAVRNLGGVIEAALSEKDGERKGFGAESILDIIADHGDELIEAASIGSGIQLEAMKTAEPDEFIEIVLTVIAVNRDFFVRRLGPKVSNLATRLIAGAGRTLSKP